jgi:hypothetical protein
MIRLDQDEEDKKTNLSDRRKKSHSKPASRWLWRLMAGLEGKAPRCGGDRAGTGLQERQRQRPLGMRPTLTPPHNGQNKLFGHRRAARYSRHAASLVNLIFTSIKVRGLLFAHGARLQQVGGSVSQVHIPIRQACVRKSPKGHARSVIEMRIDW